MTIIAIGGAEDKTGEMTVLKRVLAEAGVDNPRVHVITSATDFPEEAAKKYKDAFALLGIVCDVSHVRTPEQASDPALLAAIAKTDVIFFSGGDQSKLANALNGTLLFDAIRAREAAGAVLAGTSAGAAAMSTLMITGGKPEDALKPGGLGLGTGLGLKPDIVFDTHFDYHGRLPRLFGAAASDSRKTGVGLDENTGVVMHGREAEVVGGGEVTVLKDGQVTRYKSGDKFSL